MPVDTNKLWVFRITHHLNLPYILQHGIYYRNNPNFPADYVNIGQPEIINSRNNKPVVCYPGTTVNDYVPFYFAVRTPMLYNIHTGYGVEKCDQREIVYLCCNVGQIIGSDLRWCYTDGNAAVSGLTRFFNNVGDLESLDWHSIRTTDFRDNNADGDPDRKRKKHAEFLIRDHVPIELVQCIVVYDRSRQKEVQTLVANHGRNIEVHVNPNNKFYF